MKRERDAVKDGTGRDLVVLKASVVDAELEKLDLKLRTVPGAYADGIAGSLRSWRGGGRVADDQSRNSRALSFTR